MRKKWLTRERERGRGGKEWKRENEVVEGTRGRRVGGREQEREERRTRWSKKK